MHIKPNKNLFYFYFVKYLPYIITRQIKYINMLVFIFNVTLQCFVRWLNIIIIVNIIVSSTSRSPYCLPFIFSFIHLSIALQPVVGPSPLLQFRKLFYTVGRTPWTSDQPVARPLPTHRTTRTLNKRTCKHPCLWLGSEPTIPTFERAKSSCLRQCGHWIGLHFILST
jgi:hypothetical protein